MKVLVTGGAGFIGSHIVDMYIHEGCDVVVVDNLITGKEKNINGKARFYKLDIRDSSGLESVFQKERPEFVNHHAAQIDVRRSVSDPAYDAQVNILGAINLLQHCVAYEVRKFLFASSGGAIYGEQELFPAPETHPLKPISPYGISKLVTEHYLHYYKTVHGLSYTSLRYANVYGPRQDAFGEAGVVAIFIQKMLSKESPMINGHGEQTRDFVYVEDVARANVLALKNNTSECVFNIGTSVETSVNQIFNYLKDAIHLSITERHGPAKAGEQLRSVIDNREAGRRLDWKPGVSLQDGLAKTVDYFKSASASN